MYYRIGTATPTSTALVVLEQYTSLELALADLSDGQCIVVVLPGT